MWAFKSLNILISACGVLVTVNTMHLLINFLLDYSPSPDSKLFRGGPLLAQASVWPLLMDISLVSIFMLQHSIMAHPALKNLVASSAFNTSYRSIYVLMSSLSLQLMVTFWKPIPALVWDFSHYFHAGEDCGSSLPCLCHSALHMICWGLLLVGCLMMDISELLGIKQVYYNFIGRDDNIEYKAPAFKQLLARMRHPSMFLLCIMLWLRPSLSIDRLMLAMTWTIYMFAMWITDKTDVNYVRSQIYLKIHQG